jgi:aldehyde:ferredoxin oxidoreductase
MKGYQGQILEVDLSDEATDTISIEDEILREYLGGAGLAAKLFLDRGLQDVEPLSPENQMFILTGPLAGTGFPGSGRFSVAAKSPLTNLWGEANCGGQFGSELKFAGYDGIIISGQANDPVYIWIDDDEVEIRDASHLWGKDVYETEKAIRAEMEDEWIGRDIQILSIGTAGENLVKFAAVAGDRGDFAARCGLGAVMGSKNLKAVVVTGTKSIEIADPEGFKKALDAALLKIGEADLSKAWRNHGTAIGMVAGTKHGGVSGKNWAQGELYNFAKPIRGFAITNHLTKNRACHACPIGCKRVVKVDEGPFQMEEGPGPEFQTVLNFGLMLMNDNLESIFKANELCNRYGMDTCSCGSTIAFAFECFENGLITTKDTDGLELKWGDTEAIIEIIHKIGKREGIGDVLAEGTRIAAKKIGGNAADFAIEVKGMEIPMHDPRGFHGQGLCQVIPARGSCHTDSIHFLIEENFAKYPELGLTGDYEAQKSEGKAEMTVKSESLANICNASSMCLYVMGTLGFDDLVDAHKTITGEDFTQEELLQTAERMVLLKRGLSNLMGMTKEDEKLPKRIMTPMESGPTAGSVPDMELMLNEYYELRGIDSAGRPKKEKLAELNLGDLADIL